MKKRMFGLVLAMSICCMSVPVCAKNNTDTVLPNKKIAFAYSSAAETSLRVKEDDSSHYIRNDSGFNLWVLSKNAAGTNRTYKNHAIVENGERSIYNSVYESGDRKCKLNITTANSSVSGRLVGVWSPDCYGSVPPAIHR